MGIATTANLSAGDSKGKENHEYTTGFKLFAVLASISMSAFLMLLDGSIIGVVCEHTYACSKLRTDRKLLR
jgi:hypothetical protein